MSYFWTLLIYGVLVGALYGLVAIAFALIFKVSRVINFAQGEMMMLVAYIAYSVALVTDGNLYIQIATIIAASIVIGALIERVIVRPMLGRSTFSIVMLTIALAVFVRAFVGLFWDTDSHRYPIAVGGEMVSIFGITFLVSQLVLLAIFFATCIGLWAFLKYTIAGIALRATASDPAVTMLMGISVKRLYSIAWMISAVISGMAGVLYANIYHLGPSIGSIGTRAFPAAILGGLDSVLGAGIGGIIIGVVENLAGGYIGSGYKEIAGFVVVLIVLMFRPYGLFGERQIERV